MNHSLNTQLSNAPVVPLVAPTQLKRDVATIEALMDGGLSVIEVILRTPQALSLLPDLIRELPGAIIGAGTVLTPDQAQQALDAGSEFIVSPGLHEGVVAKCQDADIAVFPGVVTASELMLAHNLGLQAVKFFPASLSGGPTMLKAMSSVFSGMKFMPTGGISPGNLAEYLSLPAVMACGGSWLTPADAIDAGDFAHVRQLAADALGIAATAR